MTRTSTSWPRTSSISLLTTLVIAIAPSHAMADWGQDEAAGTTSDSMSDHQASSENPNDLEGHSLDPNSLEAGSEGPNDLEAQSEDPNDMVVGPGALADHEGRSEALQDVRVESPDAGFRAIDQPGDDSWKQSSDPNVIVAGRHLERAEARARQARQVYGEMMRNDYPRGEARERIVAERDDSMKALETARAALEAAQ